MRAFNWRVLVTFLVGWTLGSIFLGRLMHETCHAIACLLLGAPIVSLSWDMVVFEPSPNPLVNFFVNLAGGMGQTLVSLFFFWLILTLEKKYESRLHPSIFFGFKLALLTITLQGFISGIWEGFHHQSYMQISGSQLLNPIVWGIIIYCCVHISLHILKQK